MPKNGPIIIIEDDNDDQEMFREAFIDAHVFNQLLFFENGPAALQYLQSTTDQPFIILCDVNLPRQDGIEFKKLLDNDTAIRARAIPFIFYTSFVSQYAVNEAYKNTTVQGFFQKENLYTEFKNVVRIIVDYWKICKQPANLQSSSK